MKYQYLFWAVVLSATVASGVAPESWEHATEADFVEGEFDGVVVTSLGELRLSRRLEVLLASDSAPAVVSAVAVHDGSIYAASGTESVIYKLSDGKADVFAEPPGTMVTAMTADGDGLLVGTGGEDAGLYRIDRRGKVGKLWSDEDVKYVWDVLATSGGSVYLATGPSGRVYSIVDDEAAVVYEAGDLAKNILCLAFRSPGRLLAGTDDNGLIVEIDLAKKTSRVLLDADEAEVSALVADSRGGIYAATSDVSRAGPQDGTAPSDRDIGRADGATIRQAPPEPISVEPEPADDADDAPETDEEDGGDASAAESDDEQPSDADAEGDEAQEYSTETGRMEVRRGGRAEARQATTAPAEQPVEADDDNSQEPTTQPMQEGPPQAALPASAPSAPPRARPGPSRPGGQGNAVYYIDPDGLVREVFRRGVSIYAMVRDGDRLLLGTGGEGVIYSVTIDGDETAQIADTEAAEVTAMVRGDDGRMIFGTANKGSVCELSADVAETGTYTSSVLDAGQIARWGTMSVHGVGASADGVTVATRSGNFSEPDEATWSDWSADRPATGAYLAIESPSGRFLQYRLTLKPVAGRTPTVRRVEAIRQVANLPPHVSAVQVEATAAPGDRRQNAEGPLHFRMIKIEASDPNRDRLVLKLQFRRVGRDRWVTLAEDLEQPAHPWDTRGVGDGVYEIRAEVSDAPSNPPASALVSARVSAPVVVDNTAAVVTDLSAAVIGSTAAVKGRATDAGSRIAAIHYAVNSADEWTAVLPIDGICDRDEERFAFELSDLKPGSHSIAVRVTDIYGNPGYGNLSVTIAE